MRFIKNIIFSLFVIISTAYGQEAANVYTIDNIPISITAKSASESRNLANKSARREAFSALIARLSLDARILNKTKDEEILDMVRSEQIIDEKVAGSTYSATYNISFAKDFVEYFFSNKSSSNSSGFFSEKKAAIIIPVKIYDRKLLLWESANDWSKYIKKALNERRDIKTIVADQENIDLINVDNVAKIEASNLAKLLTKYESEEIYFVHFVSESMNKNVSVLIRVSNKDGSMYSKLDFSDSENLSHQDLMTQVSEKTIEYIDEIRSGKASLHAKNEQLIYFEIPIQKLGEWLMIKKKIENSGFIAKLSIDSISRDLVKISTIVVNQDIEISDLFIKNGFNIALKSKNNYILTINAN